VPAERAAVIGGSSTCPQPAAIWAELGTLVPTERLAQYAESKSSSRLEPESKSKPAPSPLASSPSFAVEIVDLGDRYRVIAASRVREYRDDRRDCGARARVAAVFVALALDPANAAAPPPAVESPPAAPPPAANPAAVVREDHGSRLELGPGVDVGVASGHRTIHLGAGLRLALGRGAVALVLGAFAPFPIETEIGGLRLSQWRLPVDLGLRLRLAGYGVEPHGELGMSAALMSERALELSASAREMTVELGPYVAVGAHFFPAARVAPFVALRAEWVPSPSGIQSLPRGVVGHTPRLWMGASVGAALGF
jgi:hypothetical protein